jgi:hypothetical protein
LPLHKPDIILLDRDEYFYVWNDAGEVHWSRIQAFAEVTSQHPFLRQTLEMVNEKSYLMFLTQDERRFMVALSFDGSGCFSVTLTDRQGQLRMALMSIFTPGRDVALLFLKVLTFLMFGSPADIGLDPSICRDPEGKITSIFVSGQEFTVLKCIYVLQALVGHGMKIWMVERDKKQYILKDSWVQVGRVESEIDFLQKLARYPQLAGHVPTLLVGEDLMISGQLDSTKHYHLHIGQLNRHRIHRCHITSPIGSPLIMFASKAELLAILIHVVESLSFL